MTETSPIETHAAEPDNRRASVIALSAIAVLDIFMFLIVGAWTVGGGETMLFSVVVSVLVVALALHRAWLIKRDKSEH